MAYGVSDYYDGSQILSGLSDYLGMSVDKVNFVVSQIAALFLASLFRTTLHHTKTSSTNRHAFALTIGIIIGYFCFGIQAIHIVALPLAGYIVMVTLNPEYMQRVVLAVSLLYLSLIHIHRQVYDYGSSNLDITGPLMVVTQKVTSLAFNLHDGLTKKESDMTKTMKEFAVKKRPTFLEYFSYTLHFPSLMAGPAMCYKEYTDFIYGHDLNGDPSPRWPVFKKMAIATLCATTFIVGLPIFPIERLKETEFLENTSLSQKIIYMIVATGLVRFKYYFAWTLADAICNNSGMGYNGVDAQGNANWDKFTNVNILNFELATSLRESIDAWNFGTNRWLRMVVYERVDKYAMPLTYALSALWHGFYPGYYLTFAGAGLCTAATRVLRKTVRVYFLANSETKLMYDGITFVATRILLAYLTFTFVLLEFWPCIRLYIHMYWFVHIGALLMIFVLPRVMPKSAKSSSSSSSNGSSANNTSKNSIVHALSQTNGVSRHYD